MEMATVGVVLLGVSLLINWLQLGAYIKRQNEWNRAVTLWLTHHSADTHNNEHAKQLLKLYDSETRKGRKVEMRIAPEVE